jgi:hypothetical protein
MQRQGVGAARARERLRGVGVFMCSRGFLALPWRGPRRFYDGRGARALGPAQEGPPRGWWAAVCWRLMGTEERWGARGRQTFLLLRAFASLLSSRDYTGILGRVRKALMPVDYCNFFYTNALVFLEGRLPRCGRYLCLSRCQHSCFLSFPPPPPPFRLADPPRAIAQPPRNFTQAHVHPGTLNLREMLSADFFSFEVM